MKTIYTDCIYRKIHKKSKGKPCEMDLPLLENDIAEVKYFVGLNG